MRLDAGSPNGASSASRYRRILQQSWTQSEQVDATTIPTLGHRKEIPEAKLEPRATPEITMQHPDAVVAKSNKKAQDPSPAKPNKISLHEEQHNEQEAHERKLLYISDDSCDEGSCDIASGKNGKCRMRPRSRSSKRTKDHCYRVNAQDCSEGEECYGGGDDSDSCSDSEPEVDHPGLRSHKNKMKKWASLARGKFEQMLLECIVNTDEIPAGYKNIFIDPKTIAKVERVTAMGLLKPKAFGHGVLKDNKVTGAILYGPPGTGKTLLARGVAKQSGFNMLSISTSEVWQKCHGDDEKMIKAIFSMARKMYPTIVFIDEADALLGERKAGEKRHIRAMLNQFLMEWDGIMSGTDSPFILLATNRPNDLDPAVLRRAPVRILFNFPSKADRIGILGMLLKHEQLQQDGKEQITIPTLAKLTPQYTGSDLKNLCVTAATECV